MSRRAYFREYQKKNRVRLNQYQREYRQRNSAYLNRRRMELYYAKKAAEAESSDDSSSEHTHPSPTSSVSHVEPPKEPLSSTSS